MAPEQSRNQGEELTITLRWGKEAARTYVIPPTATKICLRWSYVVWKRRRWRDDERLIAELARRAICDLSEFGIGLPDLEGIADSDIVEIGIPYRNRHVCCMPWEFILSVATSTRRGGKNLLVVRRLLAVDECVLSDPRQTSSDTASGLHLLFVQSAPGRLRGLYAFDTEYKLVRQALRLYGDCSTELIRLIDTPTLEKLRIELARAQPLILHLSGIDRKEGAYDLVREDSLLWDESGFYLQAAAKNAAPLDTSTTSTAAPGADPSLAQPVTPTGAEDSEYAVAGVDIGKACGFLPTLVSVNCYHSSSIAADIVAHGAQFAIGFQDQVDNPLMELFFANFYGDLIADGEVRPERVVTNFWGAIEAARREKATASGASRSNLRGTGIVLWSRSELSLKRPRDSVADALVERRVSVPPLHDGGARSILDCDIRPFPVLNYSLLHNDRSLFGRFVIKAKSEGVIFDIRVTAELDVAGSRFAYSTTFDLRDFYANLSQIRISLTSDLLRSLQENVYSSLYVTVQCQGQIVHENTHRILLLPINEWKDDHQNGAWLPSFVLPNDPAIARITRAAKRYLQALTDNPLASFDGYQRAENNNCDCVHKQVQAVWNALLHDFRTDYVNPPPAFERQSQRIRTPSQIVADERGTCIDLTLMVAACLEYIDIYPALFLLSGHAFVGYFTSAEAHHQFGLLFQSYFESPTPLRNAGGMSPQPWILERDARADILEVVRAGGIVPLESTFLCNERGFFEAAQQGRKNLTDAFRFESVFDIKRARENHVVPLPIGGKQQ